MKCNFFHYRLSSRRTLKSLRFGVSEYSRPQHFLNLQRRLDAFEFSCLYVEDRYVAIATLIIRGPVEIHCFLAHGFRKTVKVPLLCILKNEAKTTEDHSARPWMAAMALCIRRILDQCFVPIIFFLRFRQPQDNL